MIFTLMGDGLRTATYDSATSVSVINETAVPITAGVTLAGGSTRDGACGTVILTNGTAGTVITTGNYTQTDCVLVNTTDISAWTTPYATYTYTWSADNTASNVMNDTTSGLASVTEWFDIFIVIGAMVVLILLTVIIITAIRSSGMIAGAGSTKGANSVGTA